MVAIILLVDIAVLCSYIMEAVDVSTACQMSVTQTHEGDTKIYYWLSSGQMCVEP